MSDVAYQVVLGVVLSSNGWLIAVIMRDRHRLRWCEAWIRALMSEARGRPGSLVESTLLEHGVKPGSVVLLVDGQCGSCGSMFDFLVHELIFRAESLARMVVVGRDVAAVRAAFQGNVDVGEVALVELPNGCEPSDLGGTPAIGVVAQGGRLSNVISVGVPRDIVRWLDSVPQTLEVSD